MVIDNKAIQWNINIMVTNLTVCGTSYQNCSHEISIPLDCFVVKDYFLSNCDDRTAMALVGRGPVSLDFTTWQVRLALQKWGQLASLACPRHLMRLTEPSPLRNKTRTSKHGSCFIYTYIQKYTNNSMYIINIGQADKRLGSICCQSFCSWYGLVDK